YAQSHHSSCLFVLRTPRPPTSTLFPYTTLFRSDGAEPLLVQRFRERVDFEQCGAERIVRIRGAAADREVVFAQRREQIRECLQRSEEHTSELQSQSNLVCRLLLEKKKKCTNDMI